MDQSLEKRLKNLGIESLGKIYMYLCYGFYKNNITKDEIDELKTLTKILYEETFDKRMFILDKLKEKIDSVIESPSYNIFKKMIDHYHRHIL